MDANATATDWADGPFDLVPSPKFTVQDHAGIFAANEMAVSHNIYIRGLNAIYRQAEGVALAADVADFLAFCRIWVEVIHHHHRTEEAVMFAGVEAALGEGVMAGNLEQHRAFESAMEGFATYVSSTSVDAYDGAAVKQRIDRFGKLLVQHLHEEIQTLLSVRERLDPAGEVLKQHYLAFEKRLVAQSSWTRHQPFIFGCRDVTFENGVNGNWPPDAPFFVPYVISGVLSRKLAGVWRFLPSDFHGRPRPLPFASRRA
ncbi:hemerythrin domain-containing protein [Aspergillus clavatus NRRL 1]|uniref:Hemerythrin HHE cation binding domain protein n=1 Tax=Aspergillus clavatus (strain ATCC 1007 / CBS 513.65 / DSM 816 / NCTC 3887 / NRRL 1 / QM 1276 / 107) TaxID=344612 RepID=A1CDI5_ASPCL|nr:hemerythrin HHE cation binding domain protein [Aspergillus clavatus NRRL 1]EAW11912.1 hemerythrin HHE cation binding domain protein [Aspergillus clavatus NRRL 1]